MSSRLFENEPGKIWQEKGQKTSFLFSPDNLEKQTSERKGKEKYKERRGRKEEKKKNGCTLSFYIGYFGEFLAVKTNYLTEEVYLAVTCSIIRLEVFIFPSTVFHNHHNK